MSDSLLAAGCASATLIRKNMGSCRITFFNTRPSKIFEDVEIRVSIIIGKKDLPSNEGIIYTTDAIKFTAKQRKTLLNDMRFESTEGILLGSKIGSTDNKGIALPKVGYLNTRNIMLKLKKTSKKCVIKDILLKNSDYQLEFRKTGGYWLNALPQMPYSSSKIDKLSFSTELERDLCLIIINSSLFYLYWSTYSDYRDLPKSLVIKFPFLTVAELAKHQSKIHILKKRISESMLDSFLPERGRVGEFRTGRCKPIIDEIDEVLGKLFGLTIEETNFIQNYDNHIRPNRES